MARKRATRIAKRKRKKSIGAKNSGQKKKRKGLGWRKKGARGWRRKRKRKGSAKKIKTLVSKKTR